MKEFEPKKKAKLNKTFYLKYVYVIVLALVLYLGVSYSLTFFKQNYKITEGSITSPSITISLDNNVNSTSVTLNATGLDKTKPLEFSKSMQVANTASNDAKIKLTIERTSGLALTDMKYALIIDGVIREIANVPANGEILTSTIMGNQTENIEVRLWPKDDYAGSETTFVGYINLDKTVLPLTGSGYIDSITHKYR